MTRVYERPTSSLAASGVTRVLILGAGRYPGAKGAQPNLPVLDDLSSVAPSVRDFSVRLIRDYRDDLALPLGTVDLLLADAKTANPTWNAIGVAGEAPDGTAIDAPSLASVKQALTQALSGSSPQDQFMFLCCGHGFWRTRRCFVLADFGDDLNNPWVSVVDLETFALGLRQKPPRKQWLFFDCCSDMPDAVLATLGTVGDPLINPTPAGLFNAQNQFGAVSQFGLASSSIGTQAYGLPDKPSRFCEMLCEAMDGAGAVTRESGVWWVDQRGIEDAVKTYATRKPLDNPVFYQFALPISSDSPSRMKLRRIQGQPKSCLVAVSVPPPALKSASLTITCDGADQPAMVLPSPQSRARLQVDLVPARRYYTVEATFASGPKAIEVFADLPLAEAAEFVV